MIRSHIKAYLIVSLFLISLTGLYIHFKVHDPAKAAYGYVPLIVGLISVIVIPLLFIFKKTLHWAHILNGFTAIIGIITMLNVALEMAKAPVYPDIAFIIAKFTLGRAIYEFEIHANLDARPKFPGWNYLRYPNMGFWYVHLVVLSVVYVLGHLLWR